MLLLIMMSSKYMEYVAIKIKNLECFEYVENEKRVPSR